MNYNLDICRLFFKVSTFSDVRDIYITDNPPVDEEQGASAKLPDLNSLDNDFRRQPNSAQKLLSKVKELQILKCTIIGITIVYLSC